MTTLSGYRKPAAVTVSPDTFSTPWVKARRSVGRQPPMDTEQVPCSRGRRLGKWPLESQSTAKWRRNRPWADVPHEARRCEGENAALLGCKNLEPRSFDGR